jgi:hypothetical protein
MRRTAGTFSQATRRRVLVVAVVATMFAVIATGALAFFTSHGSRSASGAAGTAQAVTLSAGTPTQQLYPGGQSDVALTISNPNPFRVHIGSLSLNTTSGTGGFAVDATHTGCGLSTLSFTIQTNSGAGWFVPPKVGSTNGTLSVDLPSAVAMTTNAANACQGAIFTVYLAAGA